MGSVSQHIKHSVFAINGRVCQKCSLTVNLQVHHIVPKALGGTDSPLNLAVLCTPCHKEWHQAYEPEIETNLFARFVEWLAIPPGWFIGAYTEKNGWTGDLYKLSRMFRGFVARRRAELLGTDLAEDLYRYFDQRFLGYQQRNDINLTKIGLEKAAAAGRKGGRPTVISDELYYKIVEFRDRDKLTVSQACYKFKVQISTFYRKKKLLDDAAKAHASNEEAAQAVTELISISK